MMSSQRGTADIAGGAPTTGAADEQAMSGTDGDRVPAEPGAESTGDMNAERGAPQADGGTSNAAAATEAEGRGELVTRTDAERFRARWMEVQTRFVDGPQGAVEDADALVADLMRHLAQSFADERAGLERQWSQGEDVSTEDLRVAMKRYRSFFDRLLEA